MSWGLRQRDVKNPCLVHFNHFSFAVTAQLLDRDVLISRFIADNVLNRQQRTFLSFSSLGHGSYEFNSRRVRLPLAKKTSCNNRDKVFLVRERKFSRNVFTTVAVIVGNWVSVLKRGSQFRGYWSSFNSPEHWLVEIYMLNFCKFLTIKRSSV